MQAGERLCQLVASDFLVVYFQLLEERLVEQPPLLRPGGHVGPLHVVGQREGRVQRVEDAALIVAQFVNELLGTSPLAPDAGLLLGEQLRADLIGVVSLKQLALLPSEPRQLGFGLADLLVNRAGFLANVGADGFPDPLAILVGELHVLADAIVALDGRFDGSRPVVTLRAGAATTAAA